jgi:cytochrome oxidase Cu insertion factor (SCO1/SenC/PrrC family)
VKTGWRSDGEHPMPLSGGGGTEGGGPTFGAPSAAPPRVVSARHATVAALVIVALCAAGAVVGAVSSLGSGHPPGSNASSTPPTSVAPAVGTHGLATLMGLETLHHRPAPDFSLVDQQGSLVSLRGLRGRTVVLTFLDDVCGWLCPALPDELEGAEADLGTRAGSVDFVAVNVDPDRSSPADLAAFSAAYRLAAMPRWYFLTGSFPALQAVWHSYGVTVEEGGGAATVYTGAIYFITPGGRETSVATPYADQQSNGSGTLPRKVVTQWAKGIAELAERASRGPGS